MPGCSSLPLSSKTNSRYNGLTIADFAKPADSSNNAAYVTTPQRSIPPGFTVYLAVDNDRSRLYISDSFNGIIRVCDLTNYRAPSSITKQQQLQPPGGLAVSSIYDPLSLTARLANRLPNYYFVGTSGTEYKFATPDAALVSPYSVRLAQPMSLMLHDDTGDLFIHDTPLTVTRVRAGDAIFTPVAAAASMSTSGSDGDKKKQVVASDSDDVTALPPLSIHWLPDRFNRPLSNTHVTLMPTQPKGGKPLTAAEMARKLETMGRLHSFTVGNKFQVIGSHSSGALYRAKSMNHHYHSFVPSSIHTNQSVSMSHVHRWYNDQICGNGDS
jgi:hypothetical protein